MNVESVHHHEMSIWLCGGELPEIPIK